MARTTVMVLNGTFNNIVAISWRLVVLVEKTASAGKVNRKEMFFKG
jgi:hypothetical protein